MTPVLTAVALDSLFELSLTHNKKYQINISVSARYFTNTAVANTDSYFTSLVSLIVLKLYELQLN